VVEHFQGSAVLAARGALADALMECLLKLGLAAMSVSFHLGDASTILISSGVRASRLKRCVSMACSNRFTARDGDRNGGLAAVKSSRNHVALGLEGRGSVFCCPLQHTSHVPNAVGKGDPRDDVRVLSNEPPDKFIGGGLREQVHSGEVNYHDWGAGEGSDHTFTDHTSAVASGDGTFVQHVTDLDGRVHGLNLS
jgi:hypothetical protein